MFFHEFIYEIKRVLRQKDDLFWVLLFPLILGTMFYFAFGNLTNASENFHTIPAAVCQESGEEGQIFTEVLKELSENGENSLLSLIYTDKQEAVRLLKDNEVRGIFQCGQTVTLTCAPADSSEAGSTLTIEQNILETILRQYRANAAAITKIANENPAALPDIISLVESNSFYGDELHLTNGNMDGSIQYFFNLIAMACLFTSFAGSQAAIKNQANLSVLGARKCISPNSKFVSVTAELLSCLFTQFCCIAINIFYLAFVLKIDFGTPLPHLLFTSFFGCMTGIGFGFFIGSIGHMKEGIKTGIMVCASMFCCFLSGLMISNMRFTVESFCPLLNDINPAVLISDSFLTLNIYGATARYIGNILSLLCMTFIFTSAGCLMIRRKNYASL